MSTTINHARNDARHEHMHQSLDTDGEAMLATALTKPPFGAGFEAEELLDAVRMEVWNTTFSHPSPTDFTLFELYDMDGELIASKKVEGY